MSRSLWRMPSLKVPKRAFQGAICPNGMQWCSRAMLEGIAEASARTGRRVHMHFLETKYQRAWADQNCPQGAARYLKEIGLLTNRLTLAHASGQMTTISR